MDLCDVLSRYPKFAAQYPHKPKTFSIFVVSSKGDGHIDESVWLLSCTGNLVNSKKGTGNKAFTLHLVSL